MVQYFLVKEKALLLIMWHVCQEMNQHHLSCQKPEPRTQQRCGIRRDESLISVQPWWHEWNTGTGGAMLWLMAWRLAGMFLTAITIKMTRHQSWTGFSRRESETCHADVTSNLHSFFTFLSAWMRKKDRDTFKTIVKYINTFTCLFSHMWNVPERSHLQKELEWTVLVLDPLI